MEDEVSVLEVRGLEDVVSVLEVRFVEISVLEVRGSEMVVVGAVLGLELDVELGTAELLVVITGLGLTVEV